MITSPVLTIHHTPPHTACSHVLFHHSGTTLQHNLTPLEARGRQQIHVVCKKHGHNRDGPKLDTILPSRTSLEKFKDPEMKDSHNSVQHQQRMYYIENATAMAKSTLNLRQSAAVLSPALWSETCPAKLSSVIVLEQTLQSPTLKMGSTKVYPNSAGTIPVVQVTLQRCAIQHNTTMYEEFGISGS